MRKVTEIRGEQVDEMCKGEVGELGGKVGELGKIRGGEERGN